MIYVLITVKQFSVEKKVLTAGQKNLHKNFLNKCLYVFQRRLTLMANLLAIFCCAKYNHKTHLHYVGGRKCKILLLLLLLRQGASQSNFLRFSVAHFIIPVYAAVIFFNTTVARESYDSTFNNLAFNFLCSANLHYLPLHLHQ